MKHIQHQKKKKKGKICDDHERSVELRGNPRVDFSTNAPDRARMFSCLEISFLRVIWSPVGPSVHYAVLSCHAEKRSHEQSAQRRQATSMKDSVSYRWEFALLLHVASAIMSDSNEAHVDHMSMLAIYSRRWNSRRHRRCYCTLRSDRFRLTSSIGELYLETEGTIK